MKQRTFAFLLCSLLVFGLTLSAQGEAAKPTPQPVVAENSSSMEITVTRSSKGEEKTATIAVTVPENESVTLQYGSIAVKTWFFVLGDPLPSSERKLDLVGKVPLFAIHKDDAATLLSGQPLEKPMELYAQRGRLKDDENEYLYVWVLGTRAARAMVKETLIPWSDSESAIPLMVNINSFDLKHNQEDPGKVTLGKGSQIVNSDLPTLSEDNTFTIEGNGQFVVILTDAEGNNEFAVVNIGGFSKPQKYEPISYTGLLLLTPGPVDFGDIFD